MTLQRKGFGKYIVFEGTEGAGKTTTMNAVAKRLESLGFEVITVREPGGTEVGEQLRSLVLSIRDQPMTVQAELLVIWAARFELLYKVVIPALTSGIHVLSDRSWLSGYAYQGAVVDDKGCQIIPESAFRNLIRWTQSNPIAIPDLVLHLDVSLVTMYERLRLRGATQDAIEQRGMGYFERVRSRFANIRKLPVPVVYTVDANKDQEHVISASTNLILELIGHAL
jgi:dTMP kinase